MQVPWLQLSTYVLPGEGPEELQSTLADVLPLEIDPSQVRWAEEEASDSLKESTAQGNAAAGSQVAFLSKHRLVIGHRKIVASFLHCPLKWLKKRGGQRHTLLLLTLDIIPHKLLEHANFAAH